MSTLTLWMQISLDGYAEGPEGAFDWPVVESELNQYFVDQLRDSAAFLYGRTVYQMMAGFWPIADQLPNSTPAQVAYAQIWRPMPKYVFSHTLGEADWNTTIVDADLTEAVTALKNDTQGPLVFFGGPHTAHQLLEHGLVDELRLFTHPVVLGGGTRLLPDLKERLPLTLVQARTFPPGVVHLHYRAV
jgi:dihydrofolate reductase